jgi:hypothetical protein
MKVLSVVFALATLASTAPAGAQILGNRLPTSSGNVMVDGSWHAVGRDGNGNTVYERHTRDRNGNILVQRAVRDGNGNLRVVSSRTENDNRNRGDCDYNRTTNTVSDIIFGRSGDVNCDDRGNRVDGGWYPVDRDGNGNTIYERRTRDSNGNVIVQRARRDRNGNLSVFSTRRASNDDGSWDRRGRGRGHDDGEDDDRQWSRDQRNSDKEWRKEQKRRDKEWRKSQRGDRNNNNGQHGNHDDGDDDDNDGN